MTVNVDLFLLETWQRFEELCFHLARAGENGHSVRMGLGGDSGRDVVVYASTDGGPPVFTVLQCKFTKDLGATTRRAITNSLRSMDALPYPPSKWVLCIPVDPTGPFQVWLEKELHQTGIAWEIWGRAELLARLEAHPDIFHTFFYRVFGELERAFVTEAVELVRFQLDASCDWSQPDPKVLQLCLRGEGASPDLVFDVIVRNRGNLEAVLLGLQACVGRYRPIPHGIPGQGLLLPQIAYRLSINDGQPGDYDAVCDPPLIVRPRSHERFKICLTDTGYSWGGTVQVRLKFGDTILAMPCMVLVT